MRSRADPALVDLAMVVPLVAKRAALLAPNDQGVKSGREASISDRGGSSSTADRDDTAPPAPRRSRRAPPPASPRTPPSAPPISVAATRSLALDPSSRRDDPVPLHGWGASFLRSGAGERARPS